MELTGAMLMDCLQVLQSLGVWANTDQPSRAPDDVNSTIARILGSFLQPLHISSLSIALMSRLESQLKTATDQPAACVGGLTGKRLCALANKAFGDDACPCLSKTLAWAASLGAGPGPGPGAPATSLEAARAVLHSSHVSAQQLAQHLQSTPDAATL